MRQLLFAAPLALLVGCNSDDPNEPPIGNPPVVDTPRVAAPNLADARALIEENFELWKYYQFQDYSFTVFQIMDLGCFSDGDYVDHLPSVRVIVEDGEVKELYLRDSPEVKITASGLPHLGTIDHMFSWTLDELDREPQVVSKWYGDYGQDELPEFDQNFNFISSIFLKNITEDDCLSVGYQVSEFR